MLFNKRKSLILLTLLFALILTACGNNDEKTSTSNEKKQTIIMGQNNWAENIAVTNMWKLILEEKGYEVEFKMLDMAPIMAGLQRGDLDVGLEVWLPVQDAFYYEKYKDDVYFNEEPWYDTAKVGLVVPAYMEEVNSIEDLNTHKDEFNGQITGFDPGAGTMEVTGQLLDDYNLDFELVEGSEPAMLSAIQKAFEEKESIVAPLWSPHWAFSEFDLKYLEDPKETYGGVEKIYFATRKGFEEDFKEVFDWLKNWKMNDDQIGTLMSDVKNADKPIDGAKKWIEENQDTIDEWLK